MPSDNLPLLFLVKYPHKIDYTSPRGRGSEPQIPERNRKQHGQNLQRQFESAWRKSIQQSEERAALSLPAKDGIYLEFKWEAKSDLVTQSLENIKSGVRLLHIREIEENGHNYFVATVYIPEDKKYFFLKKIQEYLGKTTKYNKPKNERLINCIEDIQLAVLESFWPVYERKYIPGKQMKWCEVWLRTGMENQSDTIEKLYRLCEQLHIHFQIESLIFPERAVVLVRGNNADLTSLIESSDDIAEFRIAPQTAEFWTGLSPKEQVEWVQDLRQRLRVNADAKVAIAILDTGINNGHALLAPILMDEDCHAYNPEWGVEDHNGHGTEMAGLAAYGNLQEQLEHSSSVDIGHKLESLKILPPHGDNDPKHWGAITQQAISRAIIQAPKRTHIGCMAVSALIDTDRGRPSSWSAAIDEITSGASDPSQDPLRMLFIVSAGNCKNEDSKNYPNSNVTKSVENPGQSWNAITVGAFTEKQKIAAKTFQDHQLVAPVGGLSPHSTTSMIWEEKWPFKPDVIFEGGNLSKSPDGFIGNIEDLDLLTTYYKTSEKQFSTIHGTSAATAQAARMAAQIQAVYPKAWPETIRGLIVHSADWTDVIKKQFDIDDTKKTNIADLLRICGYGIPNLNKAMVCAKNSLTLIAQEQIQPFDKKGNTYCTKDMHIHTLPWPKGVLLSMGEAKVELRITLSYFIEPGPGEIGWKNRYRYASHALRFDLNAPNETEKDFRQRLNDAARDDDYDRESAPESGRDRWLIGSNNRTLGSIHSDIWRNGTAAELASCNMVGVYPAIGWWRERHHLKRWNRKTRYSLIISIRTPRQDIDIYTPVEIQLSIPIPVKYK